MLDASLGTGFVRQPCGLYKIILLGVVWAGCVPAPPEAEDDPALHCTEALVRGNRTQFATRIIGLPDPHSHYTFEDFDGDGVVENHFRALEEVAEFAGIDAQPAIDRSIAAGDSIVLIELTAPDLQNADCASLAISHAKPPQPGLPTPKFYGDDFFVPEPSPQVTLYGAIKSGVFHSVRPSAQVAADKRFELALQIAPGASLVLPLRGFSVEATLIDSVYGPAMTLGSLRGVLTTQDTHDQLAPAVASLLTWLINTAPIVNSVSTIIEAIEDDRNEASHKKCQVAADCCRVAYKTCRILPAEVLESPIGGVLDADVRVFDDFGNWLPAPKSAMADRNGYTLGLRFEGVSAAF